MNRRVLVMGILGFLAVFCIIYTGLYYFVFKNDTYSNQELIFIYFSVIKQMQVILIALLVANGIPKKYYRMPKIIANVLFYISVICISVYILYTISGILIVDFSVYISWISRLWIQPYSTVIFVLFGFMVYPYLRNVYDEENVDKN